MLQAYRDRIVAYDSVYKSILAGEVGLMQYTR